MASVEPSPFHHGEQEIQSRFGVREQIENVGQRFIRDHLPSEQLRPRSCCFISGLLTLINQPDWIVGSDPLQFLPGHA